MFTICGKAVFICYLLPILQPQCGNVPCPVSVPHSCARGGCQAGLSSGVHVAIRPPGDEPPTIVTIVYDPFLLVIRDSQWGLMGHLSRSAVCVSPYWYIRGVTPHCFIRRCRPERAPGFGKALRLGVGRRSRPMRPNVASGGPSPLTLLILPARRPVVPTQSAGCPPTVADRGAVPP